MDRIVGSAIEAGPALPRDWQPAAVVSAGGRLWAIGGTRRPHEPVATVRVLEGEEWAPAPRLPRPLRDASVVVVDDGILVAGGLGTGAVFGPSEWLRDAWWLEVGADRWRARERLPAPRAGARGFVSPEGRVSFVGG
ncbi:MAG: hypothetical protein AAF602_28895, partial [Myxococcota bacterium]